MIFHAFWSPFFSLLDQNGDPIQSTGPSLFSMFFDTFLKGRFGEARGSILDGFLMIFEGFWCDFGSFLDGFRMIFGKILVEIFWEDFGNVLGIC